MGSKVDGFKGITETSFVIYVELGAGNGSVTFRKKGFAIEIVGLGGIYEVKDVVGSQIREMEVLG